MADSDDTSKAERIGSFPKNGKTHAKIGKNMAANVMKQPGRELELAAKPIVQWNLEVSKHFFLLLLIWKSFFSYLYTTTVWNQTIRVSQKKLRSVENE